jgi:hypothetical protein
MDLSQHSSARDLHTIDLRHVVVTDRSRVAVVPTCGDLAPRLFFDGAFIGRVVVPAVTRSPTTRDF